MNESYGTLYLLHAVGHADLGVRSKDNDGRQYLLDRLERATDPDEIQRILRLRLPEQDAGEDAPLASGLKVVSVSPDLAAYRRVCLVIGCTKLVADIAGAIKQGLSRLPDVYGRRIDQVGMAHAASLEEEHVVQAYEAELRRLGASSADRAVLFWGSGSTQLILGATDAAMKLEMTWSLALVAPHQSGRLAVFDPTADLPIDPLVPLLRRWRYHDLLWRLVEKGTIHVEPEQREVLRTEAEQWGHSYADPNPTRLRTLMAAALMRGDASGGFAVRVYVEQRYAELRQRDGAPVDLLAWAKSRVSKPPVLGKRLEKIRAIRASHGEQVIVAKNAESGRWLTSAVVKQLNEMGKCSSHELKSPTPQMLQALRVELTECGDLPGPVNAEKLAKAELDPLTLLPARTVWYLSVLGESKPGDKHVIEQIVEATADQGLHARIDSPVRTYLGLREDETMPMALLVFGTQSATISAAQELADRLDRPDRPATAVMIPDGEGSIPQAAPHAARYPGQTITAQQAEELLRGHLGDDAGAFVLIPTGPKQHVLPLLSAAQRIAAERGIPLFLRQLVTRDQKVYEAGTHRLPMRFGTDLGVLSAALHALEIAELDTAARLLGVTAGGRDLAVRVAALSAALRCELGQDAPVRLAERMGWPVAVVAGLMRAELTLGLLAERVEVWATLPNLDGDLAIQSRAIIGACATVESSIKKSAGAISRPVEEALSEAKKLLRPMYVVRNRLPVTHGARLTGQHSLDALVAEQGFHDVPDLLAAMARRTRDRYGAPRADGPSLAQLLDEVREEARQLYRTERDRRARAGQLSPTS